MYIVFVLNLVFASYTPSKLELNIRPAQGWIESKHTIPSIIKQYTKKVSDSSSYQINFTNYSVPRINDLSQLEKYVKSQNPTINPKEPVRVEFRKLEACQKRIDCYATLFFLHKKSESRLVNMVIFVSDSKPFMAISSMRGNEDNINHALNIYRELQYAISQ